MPTTIHSLNLDVIVSAGARLDLVICDLCTLADRLGLTVRTEFNSHPISASPGETPEHVRACWDRGRANDAKYALSSGQALTARTS